MAAGASTKPISTARNISDTNIIIHRKILVFWGLFFAFFFPFSFWLWTSVVVMSLPNSFVTDAALANSDAGAISLGENFGNTFYGCAGLVGAVIVFWAVVRQIRAGACVCRYTGTLPSRGMVTIFSINKAYCQHVSLTWLAINMGAEIINASEHPRRIRTTHLP